MTIIIPSRNRSNLDRCAEAIRMLDPNCSIFAVWDISNGNRSHEGSDLYTVAEVRAQSFCYARNVNYGIRASGRDDVALVNDDSLLETPGGYSRLREFWKANRQYGIVVPTTDMVENENQLKRHDSGVRDEANYLCFVSVFIPRSTIDRVGFLDERFGADVRKIRRWLRESIGRSGARRGEGLGREPGPQREPLDR